MSDGTAIQWSEATWNVATGCTKVSDGCDNCYIERTPPFRMNGRTFDKPGIGGSTGVLLHEDRLTLPLRWRKPRLIFVNSLADLFHEDVPYELIAKTFAVMASTPQHTYQVLTKRHARMRSLLRDECHCGSGHQPSIHLRSAMSWAASKANANGVPGLSERQVYHEAGWPLPNVHVGVSAETQSWARMRIPALLETPAAVRWVSAEPLLSALDLKPWLGAPAPGVDWVVVGGESGPGARPVDPEWVRSIVVQCRVAGVPVFVKQLGSVWAKWAGAKHHKGGDPTEWPEDLRVREMPPVREDAPKAVA